MSKQAKIDSFKEGKQLTHGKVYAIAFDNGDTGEAILKQEPAIGETWEYDLEPNGTYPDKIRKAGGKFAGKPGGFPREAFEERAVGFAYSYSKDWLQGKDAKKENWVDLANFIYDAMLATAKRGRP